MSIYSRVISHGEGSKDPILRHGVRDQLCYLAFEPMLELMEILCHVKTHMVKYIVKVGFQIIVQCREQISLYSENL